MRIELTTRLVPPDLAALMQSRADDVAAVDVEALRGARLIAARRRVADSRPSSRTCPSRSPPRVLRDRAAQMRADAPERAGRPLHAPVTHRQAAAADTCPARRATPRRRLPPFGEPAEREVLARCRLDDG